MASTLTLDLNLNLHGLAIDAILGGDEARARYADARRNYDALWCNMAADLFDGIIDAITYKVGRYDAIIVRSPRGKGLERHVIDGDEPVSTLFAASPDEVAGYFDAEGIVTTHKF